MKILLKLVKLKKKCLDNVYIVKVSIILKYFLANNCIWLILDILETQMPSINDLMIKVIEKQMAYIDELKLTVIVSMFRMISKVIFVDFIIFYKKI